MSRELLLLATVVLVSSLTFAAEVRLKNGNLFKGKIAFESDTFVILDMGTGQVTFQKANVKEIIREDRFATPPKEGKAGGPAKSQKQAPKPKKKHEEGRQSSKMDAQARAEAERKKEEEEQKRKEAEEERRWGLTSLEWEAENIKVHTPGTPAMFAWKNLEESLATIKEGAKPALIYAYNPDQKREAYYYEKKVFANSRFDSLNLDFLLAMVDSTKEVQNGELKACMEVIRGNTGVVILNKDLTVDKKAAILGTSLPSPKDFSQFIEGVLLAFKASKYKPGSTETFKWILCEKGFKLMGSTQKPGFLYVYPGKPKSADEHVTAYLIETKVLPDHRFQGLGAQFVMMKADASGTDPSVPKGVRGKVGITCWTFDRKKSFSYALRGAQASLDEFDGVVKRALEENEILKYQPGSGTSLPWCDLASGIAELKTGDRPGIIYAYWPEDQRNAYQWEKKVFNQPELKGLPQRFVMIKGNIADVQKAEGGKLRTARKPQCAVLVVAPDLSMLGHAPSPLEVKRFTDLLERAEKALEKAAEARKPRR